MGLFGKRREKFVDLSEGYMPSRKVHRAVKVQQSTRREENSDLGFVGDMANSSSNSTSNDISWDNEPTQSQNQEYTNTVGYAQEKKQKLAKRFLDMTEKVEDLSNQVYHLKQRMELIEKKLKISFD
jgi:hypothetical protein